ncbi:aminoglycoside phosphotransferase [Croceicoccus estronivorus]|uniref:DUF6285 domain-containing protein n=1 Tax=Croceicoccus estronivorus TaxID=1172626 RepID=UPI000834DFDC|nr:DUF6285 domain-containing protein [Croceicoccus estronivorus]OCC23552.1 aminoglycoside phosphotransferase [Croceicoccus estronivorus]
MRDYRPTSADLLATVADFLGRIGPKLDSGDRYEALVCNHLLGMVRRELEMGPLDDVDEQALARAIRSGQCDDDWDATFATVLARTIERVRRVKPDHLLPEHAR